MDNNFVRTATAAERIKEAMVIRMKKQADLVRETGIDKGSMSHYVSGNYEPKNEAIHKLAKALDVSEMWLWGYDVSMERPSKEEIENQAELEAAITNDHELMVMIKKYMTLDEIDKKAVKQMIDTLSEKRLP